MPSIAVVDSGPFIALFDRDDAFHKAVVGFLAAHPALRLLTTWAVLNETCALLGSRVSKQTELDFLAWIDSAAIQVAAQSSQSLPAIRAAMEKYRDLPLDFADASVAVLAAETDVSRVLTLDRDFQVYRDARGRSLKDLLAASRSGARS